MASDYLPEDILLEILKRLPVKSQLRFQSVRKSWRSVISSVYFSNSYTASDRPTTYLRQYNHCLLHREEDKSVRKHLFAVQKPDPSYRAALLDVIHGVVLFTYTSTCRRSPKLIVFWNPSVRRHVSARLPQDRDNQYHLLGGGYDAITNDFKAVWVPYFPDNVSRYYQVFSARAGVWKQKKWTLPEHYLSEMYNDGCFFNGAIYWRETDDGGNVLAYFDCESEEFGRMKLPDHLRDGSGLREVFVNANGLLSVLVQANTVWTMKVYGVWFQEDYLPKGFVFKESILLFDIGNHGTQW